MAKANGESEHAPPPSQHTSEVGHFRGGDNLRAVLKAWYGNLNHAARDLGVYRTELELWMVGKRRIPPRFIQRLVDRRERIERRRTAQLCARVARAQAHCDAELSRLPDARRALGRLVEACNPASGTLTWTRLGYASPEKAQLIRQEDRRRAAGRKQPLRQVGRSSALRRIVNGEPRKPVKPA